MRTGWYPSPRAGPGISWTWDQHQVDGNQFKRERRGSNTIFRITIELIKIHLLVGHRVCINCDGFDLSSETVLLPPDASGIALDSLHELLRFISFVALYNNKYCNKLLLIPEDMYKDALQTAWPCGLKDNKHPQVPTKCIIKHVHGSFVFSLRLERRRFKLALVPQFGHFCDDLRRLHGPIHRFKARYQGHTRTKCRQQLSVVTIPPETQAPHNIYVTASSFPPSLSCNTVLSYYTIHWQLIDWRWLDGSRRWWASGCFRRLRRKSAGAVCSFLL